MQEHEISAIAIIEYQDGNDISFRVGKYGITKIESYFENGPHGEIPYIRVWEGNNIYAEFCKHAIVGVYYAPPKDED